MWQMALAGLGAGLYSGNQQAKAAERAAQMQNDATMQSLAEQDAKEVAKDVLRYEQRQMDELGVRRFNTSPKH